MTEIDRAIFNSIELRRRNNNYALPDPVFDVLPQNMLFIGTRHYMDINDVTFFSDNEQYFAHLDFRHGVQ